jgi:hypothetical protein
MSANSVIQISGRLGIVLLAAASAFLSGKACIYGAMATGLREGGWNWQFIPFLFGGWAFGAFVGLMVAIAGFLSFSHRPLTTLLASFLGPVVLSTVAGAIAFPVLRCFGEAQAKINQEEHKSQKVEKAAILRAAQVDANVVIRERWLDKWNLRREILNEAMADGGIPFTQKQLSAIYETWRYPRVFLHPSCTPDFLTQHFGAALEKAYNVSYEELAAIVSNPRTPIALVQEVASSSILPWGAVGPARQTLESRQKEEKNQSNKAVDSTATRVTPAADSSLRSGQESRHGQP